MCVGVCVGGGVTANRQSRIDRPMTLSRVLGENQRGTFLSSRSSRPTVTGCMHTVTRTCTTKYCLYGIYLLKHANFLI